MCIPQIEVVHWPHAFYVLVSKLACGDRADGKEPGGPNAVCVHHVWFEQAAVSKAQVAAVRWL